ncbi:MULTISPECIES: RES family NAD+ phosphorylase [Rhodococcus]|uniref:RES family NAD+ phosphorylase n=1 Tax=Rhodococcus TaxID=1827 RepID=UPI0009ECD442|nr:RES family NAD+ phosphorylase [Rhodococcus phenolicus]
MGPVLPPPPSIAQLRAAGLLPKEVLEWQSSEIVWRIHRTTGSYVLPWNALREFGPILRFDQYPLPRGDHPGYGVRYGASSPRGALAEAFQSARVIDRHRGDPYLTGVRFTRVLRLLDVSGIGGGAWATRVGGNHALDSAPHRLSQHRARTIHRAHTDLGGIIYRGRFAGSTSVAVVERASDAFPQCPVLSLPLSHPGLADAVDAAAYELGYVVV